MGRNIGRWRAMASAVFALAVIGLAGFALYQLAGRRWQVQPTFHVRAQFESIGGLNAGDRVRLQGIDAGVIERIVPPGEPGEPVELVLRLDQRLKHLVRSDATAKIVSQGFVGLRLVEIIPGLASTPPIEDFGTIRSEGPNDLAELMTATRRSLDRLNSTITEAEEGLIQVRGIVDSLSRGEGTLGKLIRDDGLYENLASLSRRGAQTVDAAQENLDAMKHTWPISRYYDGRAYYDRDRILYQPGALRVSRSLSVDESFEPGRAVLTEQGKRQLDEVGRWFQGATRPTTEVVIAAFTDENGNEDRSQILTQEQANAVRAYLVQKYSIDSAGWFRGRKVAAVGFGSHPPGLASEEVSQSTTAPRRVDVILFTPRT
ncbi:MAG: organic solvent resistance ABC transporter substrate-binding protein [Planctomycetes bacterium SCN 63-9]|nr:MAG: organic solvent resistance ABC transporter substrate-binding protein [Planctomycetes bacterium SCN 63-9]